LLLLVALFLVESVVFIISILSTLRLVLCCCESSIIQTLQGLLLCHSCSRYRFLCLTFERVILTAIRIVVNDVDLVSDYYRGLRLGLAGRLFHFSAVVVANHGRVLSAG